MTLQNPSFGIVTDFYGINITVEEAILRLHKLGIRFLEIPEWHWTAGKEASYGEKFHPERVKTVRLLLEDLGMKACQLHSSAALAAQSKESRKLCVERIKVAIDLAAGLGCGAPSPFRNVPTSTSPCGIRSPQQSGIRSWKRP